jgi:2-oxoglutarate ferredoxin oxidoreductase subunit alpha
MTRPAVLTGKHFMHGDHACAEGALAAGCRFFAGYPITPSTEVAEHLAARLPEVDGVFIQMEDELASMAAILGASAAGARSMTATSGPGLSLMMENLGLGAMLELPTLVVDVMRGSPSTGLPTLPGQSDVMQARWGSHGDFAVLAFSPWSPQEMFDLTIRAFNLSDRYHVPAILLADEVVGHMVEKVVIPGADKIEYVGRKKPSKPAVEETFNPYLIEDDDLVPPLALAGEGYHVHMTGLTHDERGYPDMRAETHDRLVRRLIEKIQKNADDIIQVEDYELDDARIVVVAYGCTARSARSAVQQARTKGIPAGLLRLVSIWPFPEKIIRELATKVDRFIVAEMNLGQIRLEVERVSHQAVRGVHHAGGAMIPPDPILAAIEEVAK